MTDYMTEHELHREHAASVNKELKRRVRAFTRECVDVFLADKSPKVRAAARKEMYTKLMEKIDELLRAR